MPREIPFVGKGLSVKQPFAAAILFAGKDVENRSLRTNYRGPVAIHASLTTFANLDEELRRRCRRSNGTAALALKKLISAGLKQWTSPAGYDPLARGCILGIGMLVDCVQQSCSPWHEVGAYGWQMEGIVPITPIPWKGQVGLWNCQFTCQPLLQIN